MRRPLHLKKAEVQCENRLMARGRGATGGVIRRKQLRPQPLNATAAALLAGIKNGTLAGTPTEVIAASGIRMSWAWPAIATLQERQLIRLDDDGRLRPAAGRPRARRAA